MRKIWRISIHCSATSTGNAISIDKYHRQVKRWKAIGYHFVINNGKQLSSLDGSIEVGRPLNQIPAAVRGYNSGMIAICLIGSKKSDFTKKQFESLNILIKELKKEYNIKNRNIKGHRDYPKVRKTCPCFDVKSKLKLN